MRNRIAQQAALAGRWFCQLGLSPSLGPGAFVHAFVRPFCSVVEAEGLLAGLAEEGQEIELVAIVVLAVLSNEGGIEAIFGFAHLDVACFVGGGHGGGGREGEGSDGGI